MSAPRRVGRPSRPTRIAAWWRRTLCGMRGHQWQEVRVITHADLLTDLAFVIREAQWIVRCLRCPAVRSWAGPRGHHHAKQQQQPEGGAK